MPQTALRDGKLSIIRKRISRWYTSQGTVNLRYCNITESLETHRAPQEKPLKNINIHHAFSKTPESLFPDYNTKDLLLELRNRNEDRVSIILPDTMPMRFPTRHHIPTWINVLPATKHINGELYSDFELHAL